MHKAALLMLVKNDGVAVICRAYPSIGALFFEYGSILLDFGKEHPYSQEEIDAVCLALDDMLDEERKRCEKILYTINHWRGM